MFGIAIVGILGLSIGSYLNMIIYRLPLLIEDPKFFCPYSTGWRARSFCCHCRKQLPIWTIIPILSYLLLRGRSHCCGTKIPTRYFIVETISTAFSCLLARHLGLSAELIFALILLWSCIVLTFIDFKYFLLPDQITLPLVWLGLFCNIFSTFCNLSYAVLGAMIGYLFFFLLEKVVFKIRKIEAIGRGDAKCLAMLGAWFGIQLLPAITFIASLTGAIYGLFYICITNRKFSTLLPFGPFLALSAITCLFWGQKILSLQSQIWLILHN